MIIPDDTTLTHICEHVGIGIQTARGAGRSPEAVAARRVAASLLRSQAGWTIARIARALHKTPRAVEKMLRYEAVRTKKPENLEVSSG